jgi:hypothetical protein
MRKITILALIGVGIILISSVRASYAQVEAVESTYAVKFVCGTQRPNPSLTAPAEPPVKPGNYATVINVQEVGGTSDNAQSVRGIVSIANVATLYALAISPALTLTPFETRDITCADIIASAPTLATNGFITGYVDLVTTGQPLAVTAVYSSQGCVFPLSAIGVAVLPPVCAGPVSVDVVPQRPAAVTTPAG